LIFSGNPDRCTTTVCDSVLGLLNNSLECRGAKIGESCWCDPESGCLCSGGTLTVAEAAGLGAGAITAAVLGSIGAAVIVGVGGKKGYDYFQSRAFAANNVQENPLFQAAKRERDNPLYEGKDNL